MTSQLFESHLSKTNLNERRALERIQTIVKESVPDAIEVISYGIPGYKYNGQYLLGFAAFKQHLSLFPTSGPIDDLKDKLSSFKVARGTIQFTVDNQLPESLIKEIIQSRLRSIAK